MNDRELLEMAAKAAGIGPKLCYESARNCLRIGDRKSYWLWSPLSDDGDALRLAVEIYLFDGSLFELFKQFRLEEVRKDSSRTDFEISRRAIVRVAAEIGRGMMK